MGLWFNHEHYYEQEEKGVPEENVFTHYGLFIFPLASYLCCFV